MEIFLKNNIKEMNIKRNGISCYKFFQYKNYIYFSNIISPDLIDYAVCVHIEFKCTMGIANLRDTLHNSIVASLRRFPYIVLLYFVFLFLLLLTSRKALRSKNDHTERDMRIQTNVNIALDFILVVNSTLRNLAYTIL